MRTLLAILLAFGLAVESKAVIVTATITVTNRAYSSNTFTVNARAATWTNVATTPAVSWITTGSSIGETTTNLFNYITANPYTGPFLVVGRSSTNVITLLGSSLTVTIGGVGSSNYAYVSYTTNTSTELSAVQVPFENVVGATNRTNNAHWLIDALNRYVYTNSFNTNANAMSNYITRGASPLQQVSAPVQFNGGIRGKTIALTNGYTSSVTNINPVNTNLINYGNAIRSEGVGGNSLQIGSNSLAQGVRSIAIGNGAQATNDDSVAIGTSARATNQYAMAIGNFAYALGYADIAFGQGSVATNSGSVVGSSAFGFASLAVEGGTALGKQTEAQEQSLAAGQGATASAYQSTAVGTLSAASAISSGAFGVTATSTHSNSTAIGYSATTTTTNQIRIGTSAETVSIPGGLSVEGGTTNSTFTGTNLFRGRLDFKPSTSTALANGYNSGIILGTNVYLRMSGPSGAFTNAGWAAEQDGSYHVLQMDNPGLSMTILNESGLDATPANRISTATGALLNSTNNPAVMSVIYDGSVSRWRVLSLR